MSDLATDLLLGLPHERGPIAFGYTRISRQKEGFADARDTYSMESQRSEIERYFHYRFDGTDVLFGGVFGDEKAVSAKVPLLHRKAGNALNVKLRAGDHVIFPKLDRAWRNTKDAIVTMEDWDSRGIAMHFISEGLEFSDRDPMRKGMCRLILTIVAIFAEMERHRIIERTREAFRAFEEKNGYHPGERGFAETTKGKVNKNYVESHALLMYLMDVRGLGVEDCVEVFVRLPRFGMQGKRLGTTQNSIKDMRLRGIRNNVPPDSKCGASLMSFIDALVEANYNEKVAREKKSSSERKIRARRYAKTRREKRQREALKDWQSRRSEAIRQGLEVPPMPADVRYRARSKSSLLQKASNWEQWTRLSRSRRERKEREAGHEGPRRDDAGKG